MIIKKMEIKPTIWNARVSAVIEKSGPPRLRGNFMQKSQGRNRGSQVQSWLPTSMLTKVQCLINISAQLRLTKNSSSTTPTETVPPYLGKVNVINFIKDSQFIDEFYS